jgi:cyclophilin family peptidyl-prolyl cis-trans isomerase
MSHSPQPDRRRLPFVIASTTVLVAAAVALAIGINNANGSTPTGTPTPTAVPTATPQSATQIAFADCSTATFGTALPPLNQPTDPHVYAAPPTSVIDQTKLYEATITTAKGSIVVCLQPSLAPLTVNNFVVLARNHFYDGIPFHRIGPDSTTPGVIQGGDPNCIGNPSATTCGQGGPGYSFADEPVRQQYVAGTIAMANSGIGKNTNGSQFFIDKDDETQNFRLQNGLAYNLFGQVVTGMDVVNKIVKGDVIQTVTVTAQQ